MMAMMVLYYLHYPIRMRGFAASASTTFPYFITYTYFKSSCQFSSVHKHSLSSSSSALVLLCSLTRSSKVMMVTITFHITRELFKKYFRIFLNKACLVTANSESGSGTSCRQIRVFYLLSHLVGIEFSMQPAKFVIFSSQNMGFYGHMRICRLHFLYLLIQFVKILMHTNL